MSGIFLMRHALLLIVYGLSFLLRAERTARAFYRLVVLAQRLASLPLAPATHRHLRLAFLPVRGARVSFRFGRLDGSRTRPLQARVRRLVKLLSRHRVATGVSRAPRPAPRAFAAAVALYPLERRGGLHPVLAESLVVDLRLGRFRGRGLLARIDRRRVVGIGVAVAAAGQVPEGIHPLRHAGGHGAPTEEARRELTHGRQLRLLTFPRTGEREERCHENVRERASRVCRVYLHARGGARARETVRSVAGDSFLTFARFISACSRRSPA
mmetsp:Transcript_13772/g.58879  ORF Transcript_13772/g.58879 Transcript_13772/m.58879 type:complete len:269 (+) Transcript_13772:2944-3750(+)